MKLALIFALIALAASLHAQDDPFIDHGVGSAVAESRGFVAAQHAEGNPLLIALSLDRSPRGWILLIDPLSGATEQFYYPESVPNSAPFASLMSTNGRFYTFAGKVLLEFDPATRAWLFNGIPAPSEGCVTGSAVIDAPDGKIFAGTYPNCHLVSYDPATQEMRDYGQLDEAEHYVSYLATDDTGWIYAGIGTARQNVVAFNPQTGEPRN